MDETIYERLEKILRKANDNVRVALADAQRDSQSLTDIVYPAELATRQAWSKISKLWSDENSRLPFK